MNNDEIQKKIINATIQCIGKYGVQSVTNRMIAKEADVNSAAINYYFGSKEKLVDEALKSSLENYLQDFLDSSSISVDSKASGFSMESFLEDSLEGSFSFPGIVKAHLYNTIISNDYSGVFIKRFNDFLKNMQNEGSFKTNDTSIEDTKLSVIQMVSSVMFIGLLPDFFREYFEVDFRNPDMKEKFVRHLLKHFCSNKNGKL